MKTTAIVSVLLIAGLGLTGCSAASSSMSDSGASDQMQAPAAEGAGQSASGSTVDDRSVVTTGYITVTADEPVDAASEAIRIVEGIGGRVDGRQEYAPTDGDAGSAVLTLRIPAAVLTTTIDKLKTLGTTEEVSITSSDVTGQVADVDSRVASLQASVDRLTGLLASASTTDALVEIEASLSDRQADLESMQSQQRSLGDQVSMATITLNLVSLYVAPAEVVQESPTFFSGLSAGWTAFVAFITGLVVIFGALLPWLVFFGIIGSAIWWLVRRQRRLHPKPPRPVYAPLDPIVPLSPPDGAQ